MLDHVVVRQDVPRGGVQASFIFQAGLSIDGRPPVPVELGPRPTTIRFPSTRAHRLRLTVRKVSGLGGAIRISELQIEGVRVGRTDPTTPIKGCVAGFSVDGRPFSIELPGTLGRLASLGPFPLSSCGQQSMELAAGPHRIDSLPGWNVDMLHLSSPGVSRPGGSDSAAPKVTVVDSSPTRMSLTASAYYLVPGVAYDPRWSATMDGKPLGPPVVVDGYSVGWRITDRGPHSFQVGFDPQGSLTLSLALSAAGVALALILLVRGRRET